MASLPALILTGVVLAQPQVEYSAVGQSDVRVRRTLTADPLTEEASRSEGELALTPRARAQATWLTLLGSLEYAPQIVLRSGLGTTDTEVMHNGVAEGVWRLDRRTRLELRQEIGSGERRLTLLDVGGFGGGPGGDGTGTGSGLPVPGGGLDGELGGTLPPLEALRLFHSYTRATFAHVFSRRVEASAHGGYLVTGGADDDARQTLPLRRGPVLGANLGWQLSERDRLVATATATRQDSFTTFQWPLQADLGLLEVGHQRVFTRRLSTAWGLGVSATRSTELDEDIQRGPWRLGPVARAQAAYERPLRNQGAWRMLSSLTFVPVLNPFTSAIEERGEAVVTSEWVLARDWRVGVGAALAAMPREPPETRSRYLTGTAMAGWRPWDWLQLQTASAFSLEQESAGGPLRRSWLVSIGAVATAAGSL